MGVIAAMQGIHCTSDAPYVLERLGAKRAEEGAYVWQKLMKSGAIISNGTDAPVEDVDPIAELLCERQPEAEGRLGVLSRPAHEPDGSAEVVHDQRRVRRFRGEEPRIAHRASTPTWSSCRRTSSACRRTRSRRPGSFRRSWEGRSCIRHQDPTTLSPEPTKPFPRRPAARAGAPERAARDGATGRRTGRTRGGTGPRADGRLRPERGRDGSTPPGPAGRLQPLPATSIPHRRARRWCWMPGPHAASRQAPARNWPAVRPRPRGSPRLFRPAFPSSAGSRRRRVRCPGRPLGRPP